MTTLRLVPGSKAWQKKSLKIIKEMFESEEHNLAYPRALKLKCDENSRLASYLLGHDWIHTSQIPPEVMANLAVAVFYWARVAFESGNFVRSTLDQALLNPSNSTMVTSSGTETMPKGLTRDSLFYFSLLAEVSGEGNFQILPKATFVKNDPPRLIFGKQIVVTNAGVFYWEYTYGYVLGAVDKYVKNLKTKVRHFPKKCIFTKMNSGQFEKLFRAEPTLGLDLILRVRDQLHYQENEAVRIKSLVRDAIKKIDAVSSRIHR
ncbi:MAG: hypothetical protein AAB470_03235 [Patescibacteria group bacterium]